MVNRSNYRLFKSYLEYLRSQAQLNDLSIERYWSYGKHLLLWADETPFSQAYEIEPTLATFLASARTVEEGGPLAAATLKKIVQTARRFLTWAKANHAHEFRALPNAWIDELRPPRSVEAPDEHVFVTLEEVLRLTAVPVADDDLATQRDQAAAVMLFLSGMRVAAFGSLPIGAVDLASRTVKQWPALGVKTKNGKSATTYLLNIPELNAVVEAWDAFVRSRLPDTAMWYAPSITHWGDQALSAELAGKNRKGAVAKRLRKLFASAELPHKSPHKFRHGHAVYALQRARTMADYKAVSMNLMHEDIRITDGIYAPLAGDEVKQRIAGLTGAPKTSLPADADLEQFLRSLSNAQLQQALMIAAERLVQ
ncbi:MAG TPA: tyrosine-type recombinase/integrase [Anaerolineae bacterium]|nr:tyrosine-type recombinase/integrase [Anaerolineae bacterium]